MLQVMPAIAQPVDRSPAGIMISHSHPRGGSMLAYTYMGMRMKGNLSGSDRITDDEIFRRDYSMSPQEMNMDMHMIMAMYGVTGRLSFMAMFGYTGNSMDMTSYASGHSHGSGNSGSALHSHESSGMSDTKLWGLYKLYNGIGSSVLASMGISLPTGNFRVIAGEHGTIPGERAGYMMQPGTGTWDLMPGITWLKSGSRATYSLQALGIVRPFRNASDYRWGEELNVNAWGSYSLRPMLSVSLRGEAIISSAISGRDALIYSYTEPASNPGNYGGIRINGLAGINLYVTKGFLRDSKIGFEFGQPLYQFVNGIQQKYQSALIATVSKSF
jgi:hypothetical protein